MKNYVLKYGGIKDEPWTISHCIIAEGKDCRIEDDTDAIEYLFKRYIRKTVKMGREFFYFPTFVYGDKRCEVHPDQFTKIMVEEGFPIDQIIDVGGYRLSIRDIVTGIMGEFRFIETEPLYKFQDKLPWTLHLLAEVMKPEEDEWINFYNEKLKLKDIAEYTLKSLEEQSNFLWEAMKRGDRNIEKKKQGIFAFTCGGAHLFQGAAFAVSKGFVEKNGKERILKQVDILFYRLDVETALYDRMIKENPQYEYLLLSQKLKFLGHFLESIAKAVDWGLLELNSKRWKKLEFAEKEIYRVFERLRGMKIYDNLLSLRTKNYQYYLDITGDSAHAIKGINMIKRLKER